MHPILPTLSPQPSRPNAATPILAPFRVVVGGTGRFAAASGSYTGTVTAQGLLARNSDDSCSFEQTALHEVDMIASSGSLSF